MRTTTTGSGTYFIDPTGLRHFTPHTDGSISTCFQTIRRVMRAKECKGVMLWINDNPCPVYASDSIEDIRLRFDLLMWAKSKEGIQIGEHTAKGLEALELFSKASKKQRLAWRTLEYGRWH